MSEDLYTYYIEGQSAVKLKKGHLNKISELHGKKSKDLCHASYQSVGKRSYLQLSGFDEFNNKAIIESLVYLQNEMAIPNVYCSVYHAQVNETEYYALDDNELLDFDNEVDCLKFIHAEFVDDIAIKFLGSESRKNSLLLIRLKFSTKKGLKQTFDALDNFYKSPSKENLEFFKTNVPDCSVSSDDFKSYFEMLERGESQYDESSTESIKYGDLSDCFLELFSCISLLESYDKFLYIGFTMDPDVGIQTIKEEDYHGHGPSDNYQDVRNRDGEVICNIVEIFTWHTSAISAKFHSAIPGKSGCFRFFVDRTYYQPFFDKPNIPVNYWPGKIG